MKKTVIALVVVFMLCALSVGVCAETFNTSGTVYVSSAGNDANNRLNSNMPFKTLSAAYEALAEKIILIDDTDYVDAPAEYNGNVVIEGSTAEATVLL